MWRLVLGVVWVASSCSLFLGESGPEADQDAAPPDGPTVDLDGSVVDNWTLHSVSTITGSRRLFAVASDSQTLEVLVNRSGGSERLTVDLSTTFTGMTPSTCLVEAATNSAKGAAWIENCGTSPEIVPLSGPRVSLTVAGTVALAGDTASWAVLSTATLVQLTVVPKNGGGMTLIDDLSSLNDHSDPSIASAEDAFVLSYRNTNETQLKHGAVECDVGPSDGALALSVDDSPYAAVEVAGEVKVHTVTGMCPAQTPSLLVGVSAFTAAPLTGPDLAGAWVSGGVVTVGRFNPAAVFAETVVGAVDPVDEMVVVALPPNRAAVVIRSGAEILVASGPL